MGAAGGKPAAATLLTEDMVRTALPNKASAPQGWEGGSVRFDPDHADNVRQCETDSTWRASTREGEPYADFAKLGIDRLKKVAAGKNPDA
ncbi:hypothetical protein OG851_03990 [Streptomyces sp. NBC_00161]|uniref:hypothetical protein n=1 Tax=Streptomyces sp. NBC_00161 TaxID=2975671 RepID=UPI0032445DEB